VSADAAGALVAQAATRLRTPNLSTRTEYAISVDPGGAHVGIAQWQRYPGLRVWALDLSEGWTPRRYADWISDPSAVARLSFVAIETFRLGSPEEALAQIGSDFPTVELIGLTRQAARAAGIALLTTDRTKKKSARARIRARNGNKIPGKGVHAKDAVSIWVSATALPIDTFRFELA
jgi:hypothetical protein